MSENPSWYRDGQGRTVPPPDEIPPMPAEPPGPPGSSGPAFTVRPRPPRPPRGGAHRLRRRARPPLVAATAVGVCGALAAGGLLLFRQSAPVPRDDEAVASTSGQPVPPAPPVLTSTTPGSGAEGQRPSAESGTGRSTPDPGDRRKPPAGFGLAKDPSGFSLFVPEGWHRVPEKDQIFYTPDDRKHMIMVRVTEDDGLTPLERMRDFDKSLRGSRDDYQRRRLAATADGTDSAELEYTYRDPKFGARRVVDRAFRSPDGATLYFLLSAGPAGSFPGTLRRFTQAVDSFCPDGYTCAAPGSASPLP